MQLNNVIIISSGSEVSQELVSRMSLLRNSDSVGLFDYYIDLEKLNNFPPDLIILIHTSSDSLEYLSLITKIKFVENLKASPLLLVLDRNSDEVICEAFDYGINDYFIVSESDTKFSLKIIKCLKEARMLREIELKNEILIEEKILEPQTKFYTKESINKIFIKEFAKRVNAPANSMFMVVAPQIKYKNTLPTLFLATKLKESLRKTDIVAFAENKKFYIILDNTKKENVNAIFNKIADNLGKNYKISCAVMNITQDFKITEEQANKHLGNALIKNTSLYIVEDRKDDKTISWLDQPDLKETDFRLYKQTFIQKYIKIVTPIFYQMQTILQSKLFQTKVEQYVNEAQSCFILEKDFAKSVIDIKYPGYAKITINITHSAPTCKIEEKIIFDLEDLTQNKIEDIIKQVENDFKKMVANEERR